MKKWVTIVLSAVLMMTGSVYATEFSAANKSGDVTVLVTTEGDSLKVGDNSITLEISGSNGEKVTDAEVGVYYFMPSMPAMNYETTAELKGNKYAAVIKPTMPGIWNADINVRNAAGEAQKVTISFSAK